MAHAAMAGRCPRFDHFLAVSIDGKFRQALRVADFDTTLKWASTFEAAARTPASTLELQQMVQALGASDSEAGDWLLQAEQLYELACDLAPAAHKRVGSLHGLAFSADLETHRLAGHRAQKKADLRKLEVTALTSLPTARRGKVYRRTETAETTHKREEDEQHERARWAKELAGLLLKANLPFARNLGGAPLDGASLRCCRGLRSRTLAQRVSCWRPFRR